MIYYGKSAVQAGGVFAKAVTFARKPRGHSNTSTSSSSAIRYTYNAAGDIVYDQDKGLTYSYNALGLVSQVLRADGTGLQYRYAADGTLVTSTETQAAAGGGVAVSSRMFYLAGDRHDAMSGESYVHTPFGATLLDAGLSAKHVGFHADHLRVNGVEGPRSRVVILAYSNLNGDGFVDPSTEVLEENRYYPYGLKLPVYTRQSTALPFAYNGAEEQNSFGLHLTTYRTMAPEVAFWGQVDPKAEWDYASSPYASMRGNPISYADPDGDFITWSVHGGGFSIGVNFTPLGLTWGAGLNFGFRDGFSLGVYGEVGPRIGGDGFGAGATVSQSFDYNFKHKQGSNTTSIGAYGSIGPVNGGANGAVTYGDSHSPIYSWGVSAGVGVGNPQGGVGLFVGYGSGGFNAGIGGYYDPRVNLTKTDRVLIAGEDGSYKDHLDERDFMAGDSFGSGDYATTLQGNPNILESTNGDGSYTYTLNVPKRFKVTGATGKDVMVMSSSGGKGQFTFTTLDRTRSMTFTGRQLYDGNRFNFNNFNVGSTQSRTNQRLWHFNLFGNSWYR